MNPEIPATTVPTPYEKKAARLREAIASLTAQLAEMQATFDLRWKADMRAIKRWQKAHPEKPLTWPDHVDLVLWLDAQLERERAEKAALAEAVRAQRRLQGGEHTVEDSRRAYAAVDAALSIASPHRPTSAGASPRSRR